MITVHHLDHSRSHRVLWLLEELDLPFEIKAYRRDRATMLAPPELRAVRYGAGRLKPEAGSLDYLRYNYWLHYAEGSAMPPLLLKLVFDRLPQGAPALVRPLIRVIANQANSRFIGPRLALHLDYLEDELKKSDWFAGALFSGADIQMSFPLEAATVRAGLDAKRPMLMNFLARIKARPAYQRARERGGP